jgi:hypothetical protein
MKWLALLTIATLVGCASPQPGTPKYQALQAEKKQHLAENAKKLKLGMRPHQVRKLLGDPSFADTRVFHPQMAIPTVGQVWRYGDLHLTFDSEGTGGDWALDDWKWGK